MVDGSPWRRTTSRKNNSASPKAFIVVWHGIQWPIFESRSTTTHIASIPSHSGNPTTKSIELSSHASPGTGKGRRTPKVGYLKLWDHWQWWQFGTYRSTSFRISLQQYPRSRGSNVFARRGCPATAVSWYSCIMRRRNSSLSSTYKLPLYCSRPFPSLHSTTVISCSPLFIRITSSIFPTTGSVWYVFVRRSETEGQPCAGGLSANKRNCSGRFCGFRTTCSILVSLSSPPSGRSPGLLVKASTLQIYFPGL